MQYKYNKDTNSLELVNRNTIIVNNAISSGAGVTLTVTTTEEDFYGRTVNLTDGIKTITSQFSNEGIAVFNITDMEGELTAEITVGEEKFSSKIEIKSNYSLNLLKATKKIYGASWIMGKQNTQWTRTDDAIEFSSPVPSINNGTGFSLFDDLMPWKEMKIKKYLCGDMVAIPKFYYKIAIEGDLLSVKISDYKHNGFYISPAHMDRNDGKGERDVVYISRYFCGAGHLSKTNENIITNETMAEARTAIQALGENIYPFDYLMWLTLWLLYIVEFADWNYAEKIGTSLDDITYKTGSTDIMPYHTGTTAENTGIKSRGVQYRNIEGLLASPHLWLNGIFYKSGHIYLIKNPQYFNIKDPTAESVYDLGTYLGGYYNVSSLALTNSINSIKASGSVHYDTAGYTCSYHEVYDNKDPVVLGDGLGWMRFTTCYYDRDRDKVGSRLMILP